MRASPGRGAEGVRRRALEQIGGVREKTRDLRRIPRALERLVAASAAHGTAGECAITHAIGGDENI